jgi:general L-amino acid transport system substrate-binding protein
MYHRKISWLCRIVISCLLSSVTLAHSFAQSTLDEVRKRDRLRCGVSQGLTGFSAKAPGKEWQGFDVDFCRAVAAAALGDSSKVEYIPLSAEDRFGALEGGKIDLLSRNTTWTMSRDVMGGMDFVGITYFDGQGFMVPVAAGMSSALQLGSSKVCVLKGTTTADNARNYFAAGKLSAELVQFDSREQALEAYAGGQCDAYTADLSALASQRTSLKTPTDHMLLPEVISKEPLGPVVRQSDPKWRELIQWTLFVLINAEERSWSSQQAAQLDRAASIKIADNVSAKLGLKAGWARAVIAAVGNYSEIFERNLGGKSALKIGRGVNALWTKGGILYAPPLR